MSDAMHVKTCAGRVAVRMSSGARTPLLLLHGNSMSSRAFDGLLNGPLGRSYRLVAVDLPGHGASDDAHRPETAYTLPGYADAMLDALFAVGCSEALVCGWSLGGHIAFEMMRRSRSIAGAFAIAAPPVAPGPAAIQGFNATDAFSLFMTEDLDEASRRLLAEISAGPTKPDFAYGAVARADGRARRILVASMMNGVGLDPSPLFQDAQRPVALVTGEREAFASQAFLASVQGPGLWRGSAHQIAGAGHAPFLDAPGPFNTLLLQFLRDAAGLARESRRARHAA
jgi:pimeloyl-ACP methyl ester carboxylesterase